MVMERKDENNIYDGFFQLSFQEDGVYLVVHPPMENGRKVAVADVLNKLEKKKIKDFDRKVIDSVVLKADKIPQKIAEPQEEIKIDASVILNILPDKMKVNIIITPPEGGRMLTAEEITEKLSQAGVVYGINNELIYTLSKNPVYNQEIAIAEGIHAVNGVNGKLQFFFDIHKDAKPTIMEDGRVNFRELNIIENVTKGQVLVTATLPVAGKPGKNILGRDIPAVDGKPAVLPRGKNVEISTDGNSLVSLTDGYVNYSEGKVGVLALYEVPADVDNTTGNINFVGNVMVRGNVLSGFTIEAGGSVEVLGVVEGAVIKAGGNIVLRRGMQGLGKGTLISEGDIVARYIEHSNIQAKGDIKSEAIMHSNIKCGNKLELLGKKGLLVGGTAKVGKEIIAKTIGSPMATITDIEVGVDPTLRERYKDVKEQVRVAEADIKKAEQAIDILEKLHRVGKLTPEKQEMLEKSVRTRIYYSDRILELKEEVLRLEEELEQESNGKITIQSIVYPGTRVAIGTCLMNIKENLQYCTLYRDGADIRIGAYNK